MDERAVTEGCSLVAAQLATRRLGVEPSSTIALDPPEDDHVARMWAFSTDGVDPIAYRQAGFDMRRPLEAIPRMAAAYVAFHNVVRRAEAWNERIDALGLDNETVPAWALHFPPAFRPLMRPDARDAFDAWLLGEPMGDAFEGTGVETRGNGGDLTFHSGEQVGLSVDMGRVVFTIDPLPATVTTLLPRRHLAEVIGHRPFGIELDAGHVIRSTIQTSEHELELHLASKPWEVGPKACTSPFDMPGPRTVGCRPGRTDSGWGYA